MTEISIKEFLLKASDDDTMQSYIYCCNKYNPTPDDDIFLE